MPFTRPTRPRFRPRVQRHVNLFTWPPIESHLRSLYPRLSLTEAELNLMARTLSHLDQDVVLQAIDEVKASKPAARNPRLDAVLESYREISSRRPAPAARQDRSIAEQQTQVQSELQEIARLCDQVDAGEWPGWYRAFLEALDRGEQNDRRLAAWLREQRDLDPSRTRSVRAWVADQIRDGYTTLAPCAAAPSPPPHSPVNGVTR